LEPDEIGINTCLIPQNTLNVTAHAVQNKREHLNRVKGFVKLWFHLPQDKKASVSAVLQYLCSENLAYSRSEFVIFLFTVYISNETFRMISCYLNITFQLEHCFPKFPESL